MQREGIKIITAKVATTGTIETGKQVFIFAYALGTTAAMQDDASSPIGVAASSGEFGNYGIETTGLKIAGGSTPSFVTYGIY